MRTDASGTLSRRRGSMTGTPTYYPARRRRTQKRGSGPLVALIAFMLVLLCGVGLGALALWWPSARIEVDPHALAAAKLAPAGEHVEAVSVRDAQGRRVPVELR